MSRESDFLNGLMEKNKEVERLTEDVARLRTELDGQLAATLRVREDANKWFHAYQDEFSESIRLRAERDEMFTAKVMDEVVAAETEKLRAEVARLRVIADKAYALAVFMGRDANPTSAWADFYNTAMAVQP
jgi:hypothetical protein